MSTLILEGKARRVEGALGVGDVSGAASPAQLSPSGRLRVAAAVDEPLHGGLVPPPTSRLSPLGTQRRRFQQSRGRSLQQRAKETQAPASPARSRPRDPLRCSGSPARPPQEAPTTVRPDGSPPPHRHGDPRLGWGRGEKGGRAAGAHRTRESASPSASRRRGTGLPVVSGAGVEPRSHLGK